MATTREVDKSTQFFSPFGAANPFIRLRWWFGLRRRWGDRWGSESELSRGEEQSDWVMFSVNIDFPVATHPTPCSLARSHCKQVRLYFTLPSFIMFDLGIFHLILNVLGSSLEPKNSIVWVTPPVSVPLLLRLSAGIWENRVAVPMQQKQELVFTNHELYDLKTWIGYYTQQHSPLLNPNEMSEYFTPSAHSESVINPWNN